ncbi:MAG: ACP S-malonyltransferase [Candidatus Limnocylindrales bacterium]
MSQFAFVFPGQGSQYVGMGNALSESSPVAAAVFAEADDALGEAISSLAFSGPEDDLNLTVNSQPAILATSIAYLRTLEARVGGFDTPQFYAGHSMGQYSAMVAAGVLSLRDGVRLVRERGRHMQASASDGAMAAIIGLDEARLPELLAAGQAFGVFTLANRNSPGQIVVSGERPAVEGAAAAARELGAKRALVLMVSVAAHSPLMSLAAERMHVALHGVPFGDPIAPLLANADARLLTTGEECRAELVEHLTRGVDWISAINRMITDGVERFIEPGPGKVLTGLIKRIAPTAETFALEDQSAPDRLAIPEFLASASPTTGATA